MENFREKKEKSWACEQHVPINPFGSLSITTLSKFACTSLKEELIINHTINIQIWVNIEIKNIYIFIKKYSNH